MHISKKNVKALSIVCHLDFLSEEFLNSTFSFRIYGQDNSHGVKYYCEFAPFDKLL